MTIGVIRTAMVVVSLCGLPLADQLGGTMMPDHMAGGVHLINAAEVKRTTDSHASRHAAIVVISISLLLGTIKALAAQQKPGPLADSYETLADHICGDPEYLACFGITTSQCQDDLDSDGLLACGRNAYIVSDRPGSGPPHPGPVVPSGLVECVITSHIVHRGLSDSEVNACLSAAKIGK